MSFSWSKYYTDSSINPYVSFNNCMPNCTCYAYGRVLEMGFSAPVRGTPGADDWPYNLNSGWSAHRYGTVTPKRGDVIVYSHTHVAVCEGGNSVSGSWYTGYRGFSTYGGSFDPRPANTYWADAPKGGALTVYVGSSVDDVMRWGSSYQNYRFYHNGTVGNDGAGDAVWVLVNPQGGGDSPDDPPEPQPGGHWEWVEETITTITSYSYTYSDMYECGGTDIFGSQSGTQDDPQAPTSISSSTSRINQRWEPFNMYTDERVLTYKEDGTPVWSEWETKFQGSDIFPLGNQPAYGNGWEMDWGDD